MIAFLFIAIDLAYVFWTNSLKYTFPPQYIEPIYETFSGVINKLKLKFKIGKPETDIKKEAEIQSGIKDVPVLNNNMNNVSPDHINLDIAGTNNNNAYNNNAYQENQYKFQPNHNEENLDH